jgi:hypothetical protein
VCYESYTDSDGKLCLTDKGERFIRHGDIRVVRGVGKIVFRREENEVVKQIETATRQLTEAFNAAICG